MNRNENIQQIINQTFDICVIGGGASGAGVALDAALRGFKVALIERDDFASATSSRSTKLIHGGVRYLEQAFKKLDFGQLRQVKHGLEERHLVIRNAPHLAHPLALMTPVFSWFEGLYFSIGLKLYGWFAKNDTLPKAQWLSHEETFRRIPTLSKIVHSAVLYYDGQLDDARYCLAIAHSADEAGAATLNYAELKSFVKNEKGEIERAIVEDKLTGNQLEIKAKLFINCTGPFSDAVRLMANPADEPRIQQSKGVHILIPKKYLPSADAMLIPKTADGRVIFVIPFEGSVMVGTTDTPYFALGQEPVLEASEIDYLLETMQPFFQHIPNQDEIKAGFGGLRPLITAKTENRKDTKSLLRDHAVEYDETSGLLSLLGGKWTTYRLMAQDTVDKAESILGKRKHCSTQHHYLVGGENYNENAYLSLMQQFELAEDIAKHLNQKFGNKAVNVVELINENVLLKNRIHPNYPFIQAEVIYCVREEMAVTLRDFFARRTRFELLDWNQTLESIDLVAELMANELGWPPKEKQKQQDFYKHLIESFKKEANI